MAKRMSYTDPITGAEYPASVWLPGESNVNALNGHGRVTFFGYKDAATARENLMYALGLTNTPPTYGVIGLKAYDLTKSEVISISLAPAVGATGLDVVANAIYALAAARLEGSPPAGEPDNRVSFFHGADDIDLLA